MRTDEEFRTLIMSKYAKKRAEREAKKQIIMKCTASLVMFVLIISTFVFVPQITEWNTKSISKSTDETYMVTTTTGQTTKQTTAYSTTTRPYEAAVSVIYNNRTYTTNSETVKEDIIALLMEYDSELTDETTEKTDQISAEYCFTLRDCEYGTCYFDGVNTLYNSRATVTLDNTSSTSLLYLLNAIIND